MKVITKTVMVDTENIEAISNTPSASTALILLTEGERLEVSKEDAETLLLHLSKTGHGVNILSKAPSSTISIHLEGERVWERYLNPDEVLTPNNVEDLTKVKEVLEEALTQVNANLGPLNIDTISDVGLPSLANVDSNIPVTQTRGDNLNGESLIKTPIMAKSHARLKLPEVDVVSQHDITLGITINDNGIACLKMLSGVDKIHKDQPLTISIGGGELTIKKEIV